VAAIDDAAAQHFEELFRELLPKIRGYAHRRGGSDIVDDVASETFLVVWRRWADAPADPDERRAWVYGIARHKIAHALEQAARQRDRIDQAASEASGRVAPADAMDDVIERDRMTRLLELLPPREREAFALTVWEGLSTRQAAAVLGCSVSALATRLTRARRKLERALQNEQKNELQNETTTTEGVTGHAR